MYGLTNFLSVLWYSVLGCLGLRSGRANAVTLFDGTNAPAARTERGPEDVNATKIGANFDFDLRYTHPRGWGPDSDN